MEIHVKLWKKLAEQPGFEISTYLEHLMSLKSNLDKINFIHDELQKHHVLPTFSKDEKCDVLATVARQSGNKVYMRGLFSDAFNFYTKSIVLAKSKKVLALAYANRSLALLKLDLYEECLKDIARAFDNDYPNKEKLMLRQRHCSLFKNPVLPPYEPVPQFRKFEQHSAIQSARNCVEIKRNDRFGRHVVASKDIKIGEIIAIEQPFAVKLVDQELVYCHECLKLCYCNIPCENCTFALYCSIACKDKAFSDYHKYECALLLTLNKCTPNVSESVLLPLKIIFQNGKKFYSDVNNQLAGVYRSDRLYEIRNLQTHLDKRNHFSVFAIFALVAGTVDLVKHHSSFLESGFTEDNLKEDLLEMILIYQINSFPISEFAPEERTHTYEKESIGLGLYSFCSLFNHSCCNNVAQNFHGSTIVLRAVNSIKKGEQCFVNYGFDYFSDHKQSRQGALAQSQYFTCTCRACEEDWPMLTLLDFHNPTEQINCLHCADVLIKTMTVMQSADVTLAKNSLRMIIRKLQRKERNLPPSKTDSLVKYALLQCFNALGNKRRI